MHELTPFADGIWIVSAPQSMMGLRIGSRMTVVRLSSGGLVVHSPVSIDGALARAIDALGPVEHIVAPNLFHHLYVGPALARWPGARSYAPDGLAKKRPDLRIDARLSDDASLPFQTELEPLTVRGSQIVETVLYHRGSGTVIGSDLSENFHTMDHLPTRLYLKAAGIWQKPGWSRLLRFVYNDRKAARESIDRLLRWDFDRAVIAHGDPFTTGAKRAIEQTFEWL